MSNNKDEIDNNEIDATKLTPIDPRIINKQATINIGTIGHVAHGKSTIVKAISGVHSVRFKNERERNITIKLGYANAKLYKCNNPDCPPPECYTSYGSAHPNSFNCERPGCNGISSVIRHVSFVDCPGHDILMATMLNGAAVMDAALLLIAGNESCPQPQTSEHLAAIEIMKLKHIIILQNKVEIIKEEQCIQHYEQIKSFTKGTIAETSPVVPISAILKYNINVVIQYLCEQIPIPIRDFTSTPKMIIIRSFDVNKPGEMVSNLLGGVAGGSILKGIFRVGDEIELRPGIVLRHDDATFTYKPLKSRIVSLFAESIELQLAVPGGLIGLGTTLDPTITRADGIVGQLLGYPGSLPDVFDAILVEFYLLRQLIGTKAKKLSKGSTYKKNYSIQPLENNEYLLINVGSTSVGARLGSIKSSTCKLFLNSPVCTEVGAKVALSRRINKNWRLIGWGEIIRGRKVKIQS